MRYAQREAELDVIAAVITGNDGRSLDQVDDIPIQGASWPSRTPVRRALLAIDSAAVIQRGSISDGPVFYRFEGRRLK
jgi:hypothetical protein